MSLYLKKFLIKKWKKWNTETTLYGKMRYINFILIWDMELKTFTNYSKDDISSLVLNWSNFKGKVILKIDLSNLKNPILY